MTFVVITHVLHKEFNGAYYGYGPYVKEMNLWLKYVDRVLIVAPLRNNEPPGAIDLPYVHTAIEFIPVHNFNLVGFSSIMKSVSVLPSIVWKCLSTLNKADHIHLRCPGNMGLIGCIVQIFFPGKNKTAKYAGNWDTNSKQPWSYKLQRWILNNRFLTRRMQALVYGNWAESTKNILSFFTASYKETDRIETYARDLQSPIKLIYVGSLIKSKQPLISCMVTKGLLKKGMDVTLDLYGEGPERMPIEKFISANQLQKNIHLHGNQKSEIVKAAYRQAHFLVFISESEGWPKAVAEAMWWGCLPVTTAVSCVPEMVGHGERGDLVTAHPAEIINKIEYYIEAQQEYVTKCNAAMEWSRQYTLERFENEIKVLIHS